MSSTPQKRNLTLSVSNIVLNFGSRDTVRSTPPSNSRSIWENSSAARRRSLLISSIKVSTERVAVDMTTKWTWRTDRREEMARLRVERAAGSQNKSPPFQPTPRPTSWRFGNSEKSKDRPKVSRRSMTGCSVSEDTSRTKICSTGRRGRIYRR